MPIRHCQKCGLKVLIDESQAAANPFYCQRCTTAMKSSDSGAEVAVSGVTPSRAPSAVSAMPSPTPQPAAPARATVKVLCPYCKASFNGRVPQKPARGACPVCQKDLILLPTGDIRPAEGFDIARWQEEQRREAEPAAMGTPAPSARETGTRLLVKKYAAPAPAAPAAPPSEPAAEEAPAALPEWLDDKAKSAEPAGAPAPSEAEVARDPADTEPEPELPAEPAEAPVESAPDLPAPEPELLPTIPLRPSAAIAKAPPPPPPPEPEPQPELLPEPEPAAPPPALRRPGTVRRLTERKPLAAPPPAAVAQTSMGKVLVAWIMLLLPLVACAAMMNMRPKLKGPLFDKVGGMFQKGFAALHQKLFPPPPPLTPPPPPTEFKAPEPPPPPPPPKPTAEQRKSEDIRLQHLNDEILRLARDERQLRVAQTPEQKKAYDELHALIEDKKVQYKRGCDNYKLTFGEDFKPNQ